MLENGTREHPSSIQLALGMQLLDFVRRKNSTLEARPCLPVPRQNQIRATRERFLTVKKVGGIYGPASYARAFFNGQRERDAYIYPAC